MSSGKNAGILPVIHISLNKVLKNIVYIHISIWWVLFVHIQMNQAIFQLKHKVRWANFDL